MNFFPFTLYKIMNYWQQMVQQALAFMNFFCSSLVIYELILSVAFLEKWGMQTYFSLWAAGMIYCDVTEGPAWDPLGSG